MPDDMKSAFEKAGFKVPETQRQPSQTQPNRNAKEPPHAQTKNRSNPTTASRFVLKEDYAFQAEEIIKNLKNDRNMDYRNFTTSKIRNILAMVSEIYNDVLSDKSDVLNPDLRSRIEYLKVRLVYESGREPRIVKPFVEQAGLLDLLNDIGESKKDFISFAHYMEALVAYHRYYGGKD